MSTMTLQRPFPSIRFALFRLAPTGPGDLALWLDRQPQRAALSRLDRHLLDDIGVSRTDADREPRRWT